MHLIFLDEQQTVRVNAYLSLVLVAALYFGSGVIYVKAAYNTYEPLLALVSLAMAGIVLGGVLARLFTGQASRAYVLPRSSSPSATSADRTELFLIASAFALLLLGVSFYFLVPTGYLGMDKVERSATLRELYGVRILFFTSPVVYYLALSGRRAVENVLLRKLFVAYLVCYALLSLIEINREMLLVLGLLTLCWLGRFRNYFPSLFRGQLALVAIALAAFFVLKGLLYPLFFATEYEGGMFAIGEVINWARWTHYAFENGIDLELLHRNDWRYLLNALVFPLSRYEAASVIWFREVLQMDSFGQTFGYSGLLSWYSLGGWIGVLLIPMALGFVAATLDRKPGVLPALASFALVLVLFRFMRSEYALAIKTLLWQFFYPGLFFYLLSRIRISSAVSRTTLRA
jgi:hypothetical protein